jgi:hypothetical protein
MYVCVAVRQISTFSFIIMLIIMCISPSITQPIVCVICVAFVGPICMQVCDFVVNC